MFIVIFENRFHPSISAQHEKEFDRSVKIIFYKLAKLEGVYKFVLTFKY